MPRNSDTLFSDYISGIYPQGFSSHGMYYLFNKAPNEKNVPSFQIELLYEEIRKQHFPHRTSRFQTFFASTSIEDTKLWLSSLDATNSANTKVWEVEFNQESSVELDSYFLKGGLIHCSYHDNVVLAFKYWSGIISENPQMELLIKPPLTILNEIKV